MLKTLSLLALLAALSLSIISCRKQPVDPQPTENEASTIESETDSETDVDAVIPNPENLPTNPPAR